MRPELGRLRAFLPDPDAELSPPDPDRDPIFIINIWSTKCMFSTILETELFISMKYIQYVNAKHWFSIRKHVQTIVEKICCYILFNQIPDPEPPIVPHALEI